MRMGKRIARRFDVTVTQLREANRIDEGEAIKPGQALSIPGRASGTDSRGRESRAASPAREREQAAPEASRASHTVRAGDTLWSIARRYERSVAAIRAANHPDEDVPIQPGQKLLIP